ncbi:MAG TPA: hypothetical protein PLV64_24555, partial [Anaerolineales bacterium]|nr:hypothetical protein [Anaerolineales bacterium]
EYGRRLLAVEVKRTDNLGYRDTAGLRLFLEKHPKTSAGLMVYGGKAIKRFDEKIVAIPWTLLTG